jgi:RNA polymerase sigma factor (sigma-70 family)
MTQLERMQLNDQFTRHYRELLAWCQTHVQRRFGEPEDLVHAAYLRCSQRWSSDRQSKEHAVAFFYRALVWVVMDAFRREARQKANDPRRPPVSHVVWDEPLGHAIAHEALATLKGRQRQVCTALMAGQTNDQICGTLCLTPATLAVHICRARATLCGLLGVHQCYARRQSPLKALAVAREIR